MTREDVGEMRPVLRVVKKRGGLNRRGGRRPRFPPATQTPCAAAFSKEETSRPIWAGAAALCAKMALPYRASKPTARGAGCRRSSFFERRRFSFIRGPQASLWALSTLWSAVQKTAAVF